MKNLADKGIELLQQLIAAPSFSKEEFQSAEIIAAFFGKEKIPFHREQNNIWVFNKHYKESLPTLLLNSHHDTVRPGESWTKNPFAPTVEGGKLFGLGSNDAGGALCSLIATFLHFYDQQLPFNLILAATAEEEISGKNGIELILPQLREIDCAIVGEPTQMEIAVAEKGLLVLDCVVTGKKGHAARDEGDNAIYKAMESIEWFRTFQFPKISKWLGKVKMTVTMINSGTQHNVVPEQCAFVVDVRVTDAYTHDEILQTVRENVSCEVTPRSTRIRPSFIDENHPLPVAGKKTGRKFYGSPTTSDQALIPFPSIKIGPGDSARSHTADEFIFLNEIEEGIRIYIELIGQFQKEMALKNKKSEIGNH